MCSISFYFLFNADGWSIGIFNRELSQLYNAAVESGSADLSSLPIQYADYAAWQQEYLESEGAIKEKQFWKSTLAGVPAMLQLPTDRPRPDNPTGEGSKNWIKLLRSNYAA